MKCLHLIVLLLIVCGSIASCEPFCNVLQVKNQANDTIWITYSCYPDSSIGNPKNLVQVPPGGYYAWKTMGEKYVMPKDLVFTLMIVDNDTLRKYGWDEIERNNICVKYHINKEKYERLYGVFIYPPTPHELDILYH